MNLSLLITMTPSHTERNLDDVRDELEGAGFTAVEWITAETCRWEGNRQGINRINLGRLLDCDVSAISIV